MRETRALISAYFVKVAARQASALLTVVFWVVVGPTSLILHLTGRRLIPDTFGSGRSHWRTRDPSPRDLASLRRQY